LLLARGDHIVGISRSASPLAGSGHTLRHEIQDVASPLYPATLQRLLREEGPFEVCVYCAGIGSGLALPDLSNEARVFDVNVTGMVRTFEALIPQWIEHGRGHFIGLSSLADDFFNTEAPSYSASKSAFSNYLLSMGLRLRPLGVSVTNVRFGFVDTKMAVARRRPFMLTRMQAARHIVRCMERRPLQLSAPKIVGLAVHLFRLQQSARVWTA
jgi:short-subunit dehydrogenase